MYLCTYNITPKMFKLVTVLAYIDLANENE